MAQPLPASSPITLGDLLAALKGRLASSQFWSDDELRAYLDEALVVFQAHSRYFRQRVVFPTSLDENGYSKFFYNLMEEVPQLASTFTDAGVLSYMLFHLLEPQGGIPAHPGWTASVQFPQSAYMSAIEKRRNRFLLDTASVINHYRQTGAVAGSSRVGLPDSIIDVRRVDWVERISP